MTLSTQAAKGIAWLSLSNAINITTKLLLIPVLSRYLSPSEFGLVTATSIITGLAGVFAQLGVGPALIQSQRVEEIHTQTAHFVSIALGIIAFAITFLASPTLAYFFSIDDVANAAKILSVNFLLAGYAIVAESLLARNLDFKKIAIANNAAFIGGYAFTSVSLAIMGFGAWSLITAMLLETCLRSILLIRLQKHYIIPRFNKNAFHDLFEKSSKFTALQLLNYFAQQGDNIIVGKTIGADALGYYNRAYSLMSQPISLVGRAVHQVVFSTASSIQDETDRLRRAYVLQIGLSSTLLMPISVVAIVFSGQLIPLVLGENWSEAILPFQILAIGIFLRLGYRIGGSICQAKGALTGTIIRQTAFAGMVFFGSLIGSHWGIAGVATAVTISLFTHYCVTMSMVSYLLNIPKIELTKLHIPAAVLTLVTYAIAVTIDKTITTVIGIPRPVSLLASLPLTVLSLAVFTLAVGTRIIPNTHRKITKTMIRNFKAKLSHTILTRLQSQRT